LSSTGTRQLTDRRVNHQAHGKNVLSAGQAGGNQVQQRAKDRDIIVNNSAPNNPTSNGLAELAVGIVKHMLLKHHLNHEAFMHALMEFRSTPRTHSYLPSQVFYGRRMKTDVPIAARQRVSDSKRNSANSQSTTRPDMIAGQTLSVQNPTTKRWDKRGIIVEARDPRNRTFQVKFDGTIWTRSEIFLRLVNHIPLTDPSRALTVPPRAVCDLANFPPLDPPLPASPRRSARVQERKAQETAAGTVNAIFTQQPPPPTQEEEKKKPPPTTQKEGKKKIFGQPLPERGEKKEEREGQQPLTCSIGQVQAAAAPMGLQKTVSSQFVFFQQDNNSYTFFFTQEKSIMIVTIPSLIAAGIATAMVTGGITGTAVYLTSGDADVVTGDQFKTEGGLHILKLGHMEPWVIAMMCATILIGMVTCGACCHKRGKRYVTDKEAKLKDRALGRS
jgi:hypothetical protein